MRGLLIAAGLWLALSLVGCATTAPARGTVPALDAPLDLPDLAELASARKNVVAPDDLLTVKVFQVEELDREVRVSGGGHVSLPLIGDVQAAGLTTEALQTRIEALYAARYLQNPQVSVFVKEAARRRVTVEGAVANPGIFPMPTRLTLLQAVALAKGPTTVANERHVVVFRTAGAEKRFARFDLDAIRDGVHADPEIYPEDIVVVDESRGKVWLRRVIEFTPLIGVWSVFR